MRGGRKGEGGLISMSWGWYIDDKWGVISVGQKKASLPRVGRGMGLKFLAWRFRRPIVAKHQCLTVVSS